MIPVEYRRAARWYYEVPRVMQAHRMPMAHREPAPEPLWRAVAVLLAGLVGLWFLITVVLAVVPG